MYLTVPSVDGGKIVGLVGSPEMLHSSSPPDELGLCLRHALSSSLLMTPHESSLFSLVGVSAPAELCPQLAPGIPSLGLALVQIYFETQALQEVN